MRLAESKIRGGLDRSLTITRLASLAAPAEIHSGVSGTLITTAYATAAAWDHARRLSAEIDLYVCCTA